MNAYERDPRARRACLALFGYKCAACDVDFATVYGDIGKNFIHVHHIVPISKVVEGYAIDPAKDLVPVCPNCHAMLHRTALPLSIKELKQRLRRAAS